MRFLTDSRILVERARLKSTDKVMAIYRQCICLVKSTHLHIPRPRPLFLTGHDGVRLLRVLHNLAYQVKLLLRQAIVSRRVSVEVGHHGG